MPEVRCVECGNKIYIDVFALPYQGVLACPECKFKMRVYVSGSGTLVEPLYPEIPREIVDYLTYSEWKFLDESARCIGVQAYTASELSALKVLEAILRRIYSTDETLGKLIEHVENDTNLRHITGIVTYFKDVRNRVAHPDKVSEKLDAESTFSMTIRLMKEIINVYKDILLATKS